MTALAGVLLITGAAILLVPALKGSRGNPAPLSALDIASDQASDPAGPAEATSNVANTNQNQPDPRKLLQGVVSARRRIVSGEMELTVASHHFDRPFDGTNVVRVRAVFDDNKFRFETCGREYAYTSWEPNAGEVMEARRRAENLDREASEKAGLIKGFDSHHVTTTDGSVFMDYWDASDQQPRTAIYEPDKGWGGYIFDPRILGMSTLLSMHVTADIGYATAESIQIIGKESMNDIPCWHVHLHFSSNEFLDYWLDAEHPARLIKYAYSSGYAISRYDEADPKNPLPVEVRMMSLRNGSPRDEQTVIRSGTKYNVPVPPVSWTLAGLGMKVGTWVSDTRMHRSLGYWSGSGLSEDSLPKTAQTNDVPNREEMVALLDSDSTSPAAFDAAHWIILNTPDGPDVEKAADVILRDHIQSTNMLLLAQELERMRPSSSRRLLEGMMEKNPQPAVRGNAAFTLATLQKDAANYGSNKVATAEAIKLFERVISEFSQVKRNNGYPLAELAKPELTELQSLIIGKPAPEMEGEDLDGQPLKLSNYRGKVLALVVWGHCGGCRPDVRALLDIQEHFAGRPFAIVGIFTDDHPEDAKSIAEELGMTWPSFKEKRDGPIATTWHMREWPNIWLLDQQGVIRQRAVREGLLVKAAEELLGHPQAVR